MKLKAVTKTRTSAGFPETDPVGERVMNFFGCVPLLSRMCGNAIPGAPVNASMSDSVSCNQGGTVEYTFVSHP